jgi:hypothetical protein
MAFVPTPRFVLFSHLKKSRVANQPIAGMDGLTAFRDASLAEENKREKGSGLGSGKERKKKLSVVDG